MTTEIVFYRTLPGISPADHETAAEATHRDIVSSQPGLLSRSLFQVEGDASSWVDVVRWESSEHFHAAMAAVENHPSAQAWMAHIDPSSITMHLLEERLSF